MELHTLDHERAVTDGHDLAFRRSCADFQLGRQRLRGGDQGMIATDFARLRQALLACRDDPAITMILGKLGLAGFEAPRPDAYRVLLDHAEAAQAAGYATPA